MKQLDGRTLSHEVSEHIRLTAVRRVRDGERPSEVIRSYGLCRTTSYKWLRASRRGEQALASRGNDDYGFRVGGNRAKLTGNVSAGNTNRGFDVDGTGHLISGNRSVANLSAGLYVTGCDHTVRRNQVLGNTPSDLVDGNGVGCGTNVWSQNDFGISDPPQPSCIE